MLEAPMLTEVSECPERVSDLLCMTLWPCCVFQTGAKFSALQVGWRLIDLQRAVQVVQLVLAVHLTSHSCAVSALSGACDCCQPVFQLHPATHPAHPHHQHS